MEYWKIDIWKFNEFNFLNESVGEFISRWSQNFSHGHNSLRLFDTLPNFFSPQVKQSMIISSKHGIYELPHKLLNDLRLMILGN